MAYLAKDDARREPLGSTSFKVQEFEPDRMKVQLDLSDRADRRLAEARRRACPSHTSRTCSASRAGGRRVEGELSLTPVLPRFTRYPDHRFQIGEVLKEPYQETLAALTTDDKGVREFKLDLKRFVGRAYRLNVLDARVRGGRRPQRGGAEQRHRVRRALPGRREARWRSDVRPARHRARRRTGWPSNQQLNPVAADSLTLEWVQRKFVSVLTQQSNGTLRVRLAAARNRARHPAASASPPAAAAFPLPTDEPGDFVLVLRDAAGAELNTLSYSVAGRGEHLAIARAQRRAAGAARQGRPTAAATRSAVSIRAPYVGAGLITIERERVFRHQWFKTTTTSSVQRITLPPDFEGNGYVTVQFVRDPASRRALHEPAVVRRRAVRRRTWRARTQPVTLTAPQLR